MIDHDFQLAWHVGDEWPEWGSRPRKPLVQLDMAHKGEWLDSIIGKHPMTGADMVYQVLRCELCICTHLWPLSTPEALAQYYATTFYQHTKPSYLAEYQEDLRWWLAVHRTVLDAAQPWLPAEVSMLDIGAGPGIPLMVGEERGYETYALECSPVCIQALRDRGVIVFPDTLAYYHAQPYEHGRYDLLYAWEVLEHSCEPETFLLQCYDLLAPGGVLVIAVPNDFTAAQFEACRRFNLPPWWISAPDHQCYWTPKTLQLALRRTGFRQRYMRMTSPMIEHFMLGQNQCYVGNAELGRGMHRLRMAFELEAIADGWWPTLEADYIANVEQRIGREIIGIFTKDA